MKVKFLFLASLFLLPGVLYGQTPTPPVQHFVVSTSAASYNGTSGGQPVAIGTTGIQFTQNISLVYEQIWNPADSAQPKYYSGLANYTREVAALLPASLKSKLVFDTTNYLVTFQGGAGRESLAGLVPGSARTSHIVGN